MKLLIATTALIALITIAPQARAADMASPVSTHQDMRKLWEDHIIYTRNYIISEVGNLGDTKTVVNRLMQNQEEIGNAIKPYYGDDAGNKLTTLLKEHIAEASDVVKDAKAGDKKKLATDQQRWRTNANDIAAFLASANPNWKEEDLREMLYKHLDVTSDAAVARLQKDWKRDIADYDENHVHMLMFSDMLVEGIAKQFPEKFSQATNG